MLMPSAIPMSRSRQTPPSRKPWPDEPRAGAQDVFVIEDGLVIGWITNIMFIEG